VVATLGKLWKKTLPQDGRTLKRCRKDASLRPGSFCSKKERIAQMRPTTLNPNSEVGGEKAGQIEQHMRGSDGADSNFGEVGIFHTKIRSMSGICFLSPPKLRRAKALATQLIFCKFAEAVRGRLGG
jgi:hypothetical protein